MLCRSLNAYVSKIKWCGKITKHGDVSIWVKSFRMGRKAPKKNTSYNETSTSLNWRHRRRFDPQTRYNSVLETNCSDGFISKSFVTGVAHSRGLIAQWPSIGQNLKYFTFETSPYEWRKTPKPTQSDNSQNTLYNI